MAAARDKPLPEIVLRECKHRIVDTFGAIVSGARMEPGRMATDYVRKLGGVEEATVVGANFRTNAVNAALANAMCAHADETDDFEPVTKAHPGCAVVPAALALAEREGASGEDFVRAVALGYDLCCRLLMALGPDLVRGSHRSAEGTSSTFGALGAAASIARLDEKEMRFAISYAAQQVSGLWSWVKDEDHIEKAFDFSGMGARNGVMVGLILQQALLIGALGYGLAYWLGTFAFPKFPRLVVIETPDLLSPDGRMLATCSKATGSGSLWSAPRPCAHSSWPWLGPAMISLRLWLICPVCSRSSGRAILCNDLNRPAATKGFNC